MNNAAAGPAIFCRGLKKSYGEVKAVAGLDLEIRRGECFGLLGPNGAGKTTTVEVLEGLTAADEGEVLVLGRSWRGRRDDRALRERLGIQLQETQLEDKLTVAETIKLFRSFYGPGREVDDVIRDVELEDKRTARVGKLSGGQKQRLALALALVSDPEILFLDEPTTGLDPQARHQSWSLIEKFHARGGTIVLTTHYMEEAARLCERVAIIDHGKIIALGPPAELVASLGADQIIEFRSEPALVEQDLAGLPGVTAVNLKNGDHRLTVHRATETLPALFELIKSRSARLERLTTREATLEDVFIRLTGRGLRDG